jgi:dihydroorotase
VKLYPAGATTNSDAGVGSLAEALYPVLGIMEEVDLPLLVHGEVTDAGVDIFDREAAFIERELAPIVSASRGCAWCWNTSRRATRWTSCAARVRGRATITAHHLLLNRNDMLVGGIRPHYYCLPILKRREHQEALRGRRGQRRPGLLPRHRLGAPRIGTVRKVPAAAPVSTAPTRPWSCTPRSSRSWTPSTGWRISRRVLARTSTDWSATGHDHAAPRRLAGAGQTLPLGAGSVVPLRAGERLRWQVDPADAGP